MSEGPRTATEFVITLTPFVALAIGSTAMFNERRAYRGEPKSIWGAARPKPYGVVFALQVLVILAMTQALITTVLVLSVPTTVLGVVMLLTTPKRHSPKETA